MAQQQQASDATAGEGASLQSECLLLAERMFGLLRLSCDAHAAAAAVAATAPPPVAAPVPPPRKSDKKRGRALESAVVVAAPAAEGLSAQARFWERVTEALYGLLGRLAALLAPASFAAVVKELLHHPLLAIRRRSLAFFNDYLRANFGAGRSGSGGSPEELALYFELLMDLGGALGGATAAAAPAAAPGSGAEAAAEADSHVQAALDATCILARHLAAAHPAPFAAALPRVLELGAQPLLQLQKQATSGGDAAVAPGGSRKAASGAAAKAAAAAAAAAPRAVSLPVRASALLCAAVLAQHLGARAIPHLPHLLQQVIDALAWSVTPQGAAAAAGSSGAAEAVAALQLSALTALRLCATTLPQFLHPSLPAIFALLLHPRLLGPLPLPPRFADFEACAAPDVTVASGGRPGAAAAAVASPSAQGSSSSSAADELPPGAAALLFAVDATVGGSGGASQSAGVAASSSTAPAVLGMLTTTAPCSSSAPPLLRQQQQQQPGLDVAAFAHEALCVVVDRVEPRVLLEPLLGCFTWAARSPVGAAPPPAAAAAPGVDAVSGLPASAAPPASPHSVVRLIRAVHRLVTGLPRAAAREAVPRLFTFILSALDYRWRAADPSAVAAALGGGGAAPLAVEARARLAAADAAASLVEGELLPAFAGLLLKLSEAQVRPLLLKLLQWGATEPADIRAALVVLGDVPDSSGGGGDQEALFAYAALARRVALARLFEACTAVLRSVFLPLFGYVMPALTAELTAAAAVRTSFRKGSSEAHAGKGDSAAATGKRGSAKPLERGGAAAATAIPRKRVRIQEPPSSSEEEGSGSGSGSDDSGEDDGSGESSGVEDDDEEEDEEEDDNEEAADDEEGESGGSDDDGDAEGGDSSAFDLGFLDAVWCAPVLHDAVTGAAHSLVATAPHALRCVALACLRAAFLYDTAPDPDGFMARGGRERLEAVLRPLALQYELPVVAAGAASASNGGGVPGGAEGYAAFADAYLLPVVGNLVVALRRDTLWKGLNTALLHLTRDRRPRVRLAALRSVGTVFARGGDEALVLLPESLPFLSELIHDVDARVEVAAAALLRDLERASGEDLQSFLA